MDSIIAIYFLTGSTGWTGFTGFCFINFLLESMKTMKDPDNLVHPVRKNISQ
jgi:hypothetical protein